MKAVGIIAEYNPFHNGHKYHAEMARKQAQADVVVAVMSGNFTQRGEPAIVDKWQRAEMALSNGIDLVIELPYRYAVQPADIFASGGVSVLNQLGCEAIAFGVETDDHKKLLDIAIFYSENEAEIEKALLATEENKVFAERFADALSHVSGERMDTSLWSKPNNQLAIQYLLANNRLAKPLEPIFIQRFKSEHGDLATNNRTIASGTAIRHLATTNQSIKNFVPRESYAMLEQQKLITIADFWPYLKYQLSIYDAQSLRNIYQMTEGLEHRLLQQFDVDMTFKDYLEAVKSKRYTYARLTRLLNYVLVKISNEEMLKEQPVPMRLLGFNKTGQTFLNEIKNKQGKKVISRLSKDAIDDFELDIRAGNVYRLVDSDHIGKQDFDRIPVIK